MAHIWKTACGLNMAFGKTVWLWGFLEKTWKFPCFEFQKTQSSTDVQPVSTVRGTELRVRPTNLKTRCLPQFWSVNRTLAYFFYLCFRWAQMKDNNSMSTDERQYFDEHRWKTILRWAQMKDNTSMSTDERQYFDEHRWKTILRCLYLHIWIPKPSIRWETWSLGIIE